MSHDGYANANVSSVIAQAGVSRRAFYEYFSNKDDCFLAAQRDVLDQLADHVVAAMERKTPRRATEIALRALVDFAQSQPVMARFAMTETLCGKRALEAREEALARIAAIVESAHSEAPVAARSPDIPAEIALGATYRLIATRLRRGESNLAPLLEGLLAWLRSYEHRVDEHRWRFSPTFPPPLPSPSTLARTAAVRPPARLPLGRPRMSRREVTANHRMRIIIATATLAAERSYGNTTVTDIAERAQLDPRAFYKLFVGKQDAFMAAYELGFQELMAATVGAFFEGASWPERTWAAGRVFTLYLERNPTVARTGFVEAYALSPDAIARVENSHAAFTLFLREGHRPRSGVNSPAPLTLEATIAAIFEIVHREARRPEALGLTARWPSVAHLCLAPSLGSRDANAFIDRQLERGL